MATNTQFDWRRSDRRVYAAVAVFFVLVVLLGFGRTYYFRFAVDGPAVPSLLVHLHGFVMTLWVAFFVSQVWLIRTMRAKVHMNMGMLGIKSFASIINEPHGMIMSIGAGEKRPIVKNDALAIATMMTVTVTCDHRVVDGALGAAFLKAFKSFLEDPMAMLL